MGIGPIEILVLLIVALLVIGPEKMPEVARALARVMRDLRGAMDEVRGQFDDITREDLFDTKEIESYYRDTIDGVKKAVEVPEDLTEGIEQATRSVEEIGKDVGDSIKQIDKPPEPAAQDTQDVGGEDKPAESVENSDAPDAEESPTQTST